MGNSFCVLMVHGSRGLARKQTTRFWYHFAWNRSWEVWSLGSWGACSSPEFGVPQTKKVALFGKDKIWDPPAVFLGKSIGFGERLTDLNFNLPKNLLWFHEIIVWLNLKPRMWASKERKKPKNGNSIRITFGCPGTEARISELGVSNIPYTLLD